MIRALSISVVATTVLLAACGGSQSPIASPGAIPQSRAITAHAARSGSWMLPEAKSEDLLYVSNWSNADVYVYAYPSGKAVGRLRGFQRAGGLCSDHAGNVWIGQTDEITEYAHGGTEPLRTLNDEQKYEGYMISACSVDSVTGDLAVVNFGDFGSSSPGDVAIFANASGSPKLYYCKLYPFSATYDDRENLFAYGRLYGSSHIGALGELKPSASNFRLLRLHDVKAYEVGGVAWDGKHVVIGTNAGSSDPTTLFQLRFEAVWQMRSGRSSSRNQLGFPSFGLWAEGCLRPIGREHPP